MSAPFMAIVAAGCRMHLVPERRPVLARSGPREDLPVGANKIQLSDELKTTALCGQLSSSSACPEVGRTRECQMEIPSADPCGHAHGGFAPVRVKGQKPKPTDCSHDRLSQAPPVLPPTSGAVLRLPQAHLCGAIVLGSADVTRKRQCPQKPWSWFASLCNLS